MFGIVLVFYVFSCTTIAEVSAIIYGSVFKSASIINLESNVTSYAVGCKLESTRSGIDSQFLNLYIVNRRIESQIVNKTTIISEVNLLHSNEADVCGVKTYTCKLNETVVHSAAIFVGRPPNPVQPADFKCVSENRDYLLCEFPRNDYCDLNTLYKLSLLRMHRLSECELAETAGGRMHFDSRTDTCLYSNGYRSITFELESQNIIGKTVKEIDLNHYDFVRPAQPKMLEVFNITSTSVEVAWNLNVKLLRLERDFEYEFVLVSEHDTQNSSFVTRSFESNERMFHSLLHLYPYTEYELKVRVRIIPINPRRFEEEYWSDWSLALFRTVARKPYEAPVTIPGAYSLNGKNDDVVTVEVYWQHVPKYLQNGPGFEYNVSAVSKSGQRFFPSSTGNASATFQHMKIGHYRVQVSCYNIIGSADKVNEIHIFPPNENLRPKIKRVLFDGTYHLTWFQAPNTKDLLSYTIMYCTFTATASCRESINFVVMLPTETSFNVSTTGVPNFAISANYRDHSSDFSWQQCVVSSESGISHPVFNFTDVSLDSFTIRMNSSCTDQSLVQRYEVQIWSEADRTAVQNMSFNPYVHAFPIKGMRSDVDYEVMVVAYDRYGIAHKTVARVHTLKSGLLLQIVFYLICGILIASGMGMIATRKMKKILNIKVDIPLGLVGLDEKLDNENNNEIMEKLHPHDYMDKEEEPPAFILKEEVEPSPESVVRRPSENLLTQTTAVANSYVLPSQMACSKNVPKANQSSSQSTASSGYVALHQFPVVNDYVSPSQMPCSKDVPKENQCSGLSSNLSGYVALNQMIKQDIVQ